MNNKAREYQKILSKMKSVLETETDSVLIMSAVSTLLKSHFDHFIWAGFYRRTSRRGLSVGPYQGNWGVLHIEFGKGVCGKAAESEKTIIVSDVTKFPGYIECDNQTKSEIVVPVFDTKKHLIAVLDIDSSQLNAFDELDKEYLEEIVKIFSKLKKNPPRDVSMNEYAWVD